MSMIGLFTAAPRPASTPAGSAAEAGEGFSTALQDALVGLASAAEGDHGVSEDASAQSAAATELADGVPAGETPGGASTGSATVTFTTALELAVPELGEGVDGDLPGSASTLRPAQGTSTRDSEALFIDGAGAQTGGDAATGSATVGGTTGAGSADVPSEGAESITSPVPAAVPEPATAPELVEGATSSTTTIGSTTATASTGLGTEPTLRPEVGRPASTGSASGAGSTTASSPATGGAGASTGSGAATSSATAMNSGAATGPATASPAAGSAAVSSASTTTAAAGATAPAGSRAATTGHTAAPTQSTTADAPVAVSPATGTASAAPSSTVAPAAPAAPAASVPFAAQLSRPIFSLASAGNGQHVMTVSVTPDELGPVTVRAHVGAEGVRVELFAPNDQGREAIRAVLTELRRDLAGAGLGGNLSLSSQNQPPAAHTGTQAGSGQAGAHENGADQASTDGDGARSDQAERNDSTDAHRPGAGAQPRAGLLGTSTIDVMA